MADGAIERSRGNEGRLCKAWKIYKAMLADQEKKYPPTQPHVPVPGGITAAATTANY
jgi:hypothetical protein